MSVEKIGGYSTSGLLMMHHGIRQALEVDDNLFPKAEKTYGVREYPDWRRWSDAIESELNRRQVKYQKVAW